MDRETSEEIDQPLYDRVDYPGLGAYELRFFHVPVGGTATLIRAGAAAAVVKTRRDTNMEQEAVIPAKRFRMRGVEIVYLPPITDPDRQWEILRSGGVLHLDFAVEPDNWRRYLDLPLHRVPILDDLVDARTCLRSYNLAVPLFVDPYIGLRAQMLFDGSPRLPYDCDIQLFLCGTMRMRR